MKVRLNRFIAQSGYCSRRKADELIKEGKVKVNGQKVLQLGMKIDPEKDLVEVEGKIIKNKEKKVYIKLYKPVGYLTQLGKDRFGRKTLTDLFKETGIKERLFPAGRLDYNSEGLLVLTNDGDFANLLMHPRKKIPKKYIVEVEGRVNAETFNRMRKGKKLKDTYLKPDEIKLLKKKRNSTVIEITIHSGQKRVVRRFMASFGHPVYRLLRISVGSITIENLKPKEWKEIPEKEIKKTVKMAAVK
ncbi:rRNA pseudouridine synthase [Persephonella atlantica]|uniref:Pseudouridine synthase n=1 Tax=Persephonella atlantica TaxID=2699429 RepID=A0ABS1GHZ1_9AQUI|nr:pseudouridine synthase [Persephonella atlantica]MBK3332552.1 rRNA pseudouridine synthase [Persephonella atlantica]